MEVIYVSAFEVAEMANASDHKSIQIILDELSKKLCTKVEFGKSKFRGEDLLIKHSGMPVFYELRVYNKVEVKDILELINKGADVELLQKMFSDNDLAEFDIIIDSKVDYKMTERQKEIMSCYSAHMHWINWPSQKLDSKFREICSKDGLKQKLTESIDCTELFKEWIKDKCVIMGGDSYHDNIFKDLSDLCNQDIKFSPSCEIGSQNDIKVLNELVKHMQKFNISKSKLVWASWRVGDFMKRVDSILDAVIKPSNVEDLQKKLSEITKLLN